MAARSTRIDALRGLAVFGIMLVNVWGFVYGMDMHRFPAPGGTLPLADQAAVFFAAAFAEQKFYPIFACLFGAGFALQTGRARAPGPALDATRTLYRRRLRWLLVAGLLHAGLLWFGDILTIYALTGYWLVHKAGQRLARLAASLRLLVIVNCVTVALSAALLLVATLLPADEALGFVKDSQRVHAVYTQGGWLDVAGARLADFGISIPGWLIVIPRIALLFLLGVFAVRLGWITRPERYRAMWRKVLLAALAVGLPLNLWWGAASVAGALDPAARLSMWLSTAMIEVAGPLLGAGYAAVFMLAGPGFARFLVPVGRMALTNYLAQSLILMLLLQGFGLGLGAQLSRAALLGLCVPLMLGQLLFSHWWLARHAQGPLEALWRRYTYRGEKI